jgi:hypothetical protein
MDWPFWLVSPKLLHYKRGNSGKGKERKPVLLSGAGAIVSCASSLIWLAKIGLDSDRRKTGHRLMHSSALNDCYSMFTDWHN